MLWLLFIKNIYMIWLNVLIYPNRFHIDIYILCIGINVLTVLFLCCKYIRTNNATSIPKEKTMPQVVWGKEN